MIPGDRLLTIGEVALLIGVSRQRADQLSRQTGFPAVAIEGLRIRLWREDRIRAWDRERRRILRDSKQTERRPTRARHDH